MLSILHLFLSYENLTKISKSRFFSVQFSLFVSPQTLQSEHAHSIYFKKINVARKPKKNPIQLILFGLPCDNFLFSSSRITVVRWQSFSNSKDNCK